MSNLSKILVLKEETKLLNAEAKLFIAEQELETKLPSEFVKQSHNILKRYLSSPETLNRAKEIMNSILKANQEGGIENVMNMNRDAYTDAERGLHNWLRNKANSDAKKGIELPPTIDSIADELVSNYKISLANKAEEKEKAKQAEIERKSKLSPSELEQEEKKEKQKQEWNQLMAIYGGESNYKSGRGLGT